MNLRNISNEFKSSIILKPSTLLIIGTLFLLFSSQYSIGLKAFSVIAISVILYYIGERYSKVFNPRLLISRSALFYFGAALILLSLAALYFNLYTAGGIPLFNAALRRFLSGNLTYLSFLIVPGIIFMIASFDKRTTHRSKLKTLFLILFAAGAMSLLGFRTEVLAAIIAGTLTAYYSEIFDVKELLALALLALVAFSGVSYIRNAPEAAGRAGATLAIFDLTVERTPVFGLTHGFVQFADIISIPTITPIYSGRVLISDLIGGRIAASSTATLYAPPFLDFGFPGLAIFVFFGFLIGATHKAAAEKKNIYSPLHALLLTFLLLGIETGIVDLIVWIYFGFAAIFVIIAHNYR